MCVRHNGLMGESARPGAKLRLVLLIGFGGLLALLLIAGLDALATLRQLHAEEQQARAAFLERNQSLLTFRASLDIYGERVEHMFLTFSPGEDLSVLSRQIHDALGKYPSARQPEEAQMLAALAALVVDQEHAVTAALSGEERANRDKMYRYLCDNVLPRHLRLVEATEKIAVWQNRQLSGNDEELLAKFADLRSHLTKLLAVVLSSGLLLAMGSIVYIAGQDREARRRYAELSQLSARLADAQEEERRSIARELHDEVGQSLGALLVDLDRLNTMLEPDNSAAREQLERIRKTAARSVASVRNIALLLRPSMLDDLGLVAAIEWLGREISRGGDLEVEVEAPEIPVELPEDLKICIYRVAQEALHNAARHSGGRHAWVKIENREGRIVVTVRDDGRGFDPERSRGMGLIGMEERVRRLRGTLVIESKPGQGTLVKAELPPGA